MQISLTIQYLNVENIFFSSPFYVIFTIKFIISIQMIALAIPQFLDVFYWKTHPKLSTNAYYNGRFRTLRLPMSNLHFDFLLLVRKHWHDYRCRRQEIGGRKGENSSATAFQTIKCMLRFPFIWRNNDEVIWIKSTLLTGMITLKRKLRRIRENKEIERLAKCT